MCDSLRKNSENVSFPFMDVLVEYAFKRVFGSAQNKSILIAMLNVYLSDYIGVITDIELLPTEQLGILPSDKKMSYDVYGKAQDEHRFLLEMQRGKQTFYSRRAIAYVSRAVSNELVRGDREYNFPNIISLNFLDYHDPIIMGERAFIQRVMLKNEENKNFSVLFLISYIAGNKIVDKKKLFL